MYQNNTLYVFKTKICIKTAHFMFLKKTWCIKIVHFMFLRAQSFKYYYNGKTVVSECVNL